MIFIIKEKEYDLMVILPENDVEESDVLFRWIF